MLKHEELNRETTVGDSSCTHCKLVQPVSVSLSNDVTLEGITKVSTDQQPENIFLPNFVMPVPIVMEDRFRHSLKQSSSKVVTLLGITMLVSFEFLKALPSIVTIPVKSKDMSPEFWKQALGIVF